jgi:hypothetical protein
MMYPVTVECWNAPAVLERMIWAKEHGMLIVNKTWEVVDQRQHVTFNFHKQEHATMFALRWQ